MIEKTPRQFVDFLEGGKVGIAVMGAESEFEKSFDTREEILESMLSNQDELDLAREPAKSITSDEAVYLIAARHVELSNKIASGEKPSTDFFKDLAEKDSVDLSRLDDKQRKKVQDDIDLASSISPIYSQIIAAGIEAGRNKDTPSALSDAELEELRRKVAAANTTETEQKRKAEMDNAVVVSRSGSELPRGLFIIPPSIAKDYLANDGEYYSKKDHRLMFHESPEGNSLHTNYKDEKSIADMLEVARAKQWSSITLEGSKEFRRAAWLAAESTGIKTKGYTPTKEDLSLLQAKIKEQPLNSIRNADAIERSAPRTPGESRHASIATDAKLNLSKHLQDLSENPAFNGRDHQEIIKIAEMRALMDEEMRVAGKSDTERADYLAKYDKTMEEPRTLMQIEKAATVERDQALPPPKTRSAEVELSR